MDRVAIKERIAQMGRFHGPLRTKEEEREYNMRRQRHLYRSAGQKLADRNETFIWLVNNGLTATDLRRSIERWPERYAMYAGFLDKLPP